MGARGPRLVLQRRRRTLLSLNARQIAQLVEELEPLLVSLRLRDVQALPPRDVVLVFEPDDAGEGPAVFRLRLSADPDNSRIHLQQGRLHRGKGPVGPFYRRLEEELVGGRLTKISQVRSDRILLLELRETPGGAPRGLMAELTGRHGNLVLLDRDDRVVDLLVPPPASQEFPRLVVGQTWAPPAGQAPRTESQHDIEQDYAQPDEIPPGCKLGFPPLAPLSWRVETWLGGASRERDLEAARKKLRKRIERKRGRALSLLNGLKNKLEACERSERLRFDGELLSANLQRVKRGAKFVEVEDWFDADTPVRRIELDPRRTPQENAQHYFERYKKLERSKSEIPAELALAQERFDALEDLFELSALEDQDPAELDRRGVEEGLLDPPQEADPRKRKAPAPRVPYRSFVTIGGLEVRVGRTARDNDALTFRNSNGNDVWLHTADAPGSHVVLRMGKSGGKQSKAAEPEHEDLLDAAHLAVHFSPLRASSKANVHVAPIKLVHKPRGAKPGLVTLSGGRNLQVRMQPERLARLLRPKRGH